MVDCPACADSSLVELTVERGARVELCQRCKGMLLDESALERLLGSCDVLALTAPGAEPAALRPCLRCNTTSWERRTIAHFVNAVFPGDDAAPLFVGDKAPLKSAGDRTPGAWSAAALPAKRDRG